MSTLRRGLSGEPVRRLQQKLGVIVDGDFGPITEKALKDYQRRNKLEATGRADLSTFVQMQLLELVQLKIGTSGDLVKKLQNQLGIPADGQFGSGTAAAVSAFQKEQGQKEDGVAGPETLAKMTMFSEFTPDIVTKSRVTDANGVPVELWATVRSYFK